MYSRTYGQRKTWLYKCLKSALSENSRTSNMVNWPKHCSKHSGSTFTVFFDAFEHNYGYKSLSD